jgi:hypothetical protein
MKIKAHFNLLVRVVSGAVSIQWLMENSIVVQSTVLINLTFNINV